MSLCDPIADMLTRIRNAQMVEHRTAEVLYSKMGLAMLAVLQEEGYIEGFEVVSREGSAVQYIVVTLKYYAGSPVIDKITRISRPGLRVYKKASELLPVLNGLGIAIISTSSGVLTDKQARQKNVGGELLCIVS